MTRRACLATAATIALVALPTAALAYDAPGFDTTTTDPTPALGEPITLSTSGAEPGEQVTATVTTDPASISNDAITIAGTKSMTKAADANGVVAFSVTLNAAGTFTVRITDASGALLGDEVLQVAAPAGAAGTNTGVQLSDTGFDAAGLAAGAAALVVAGAGAVVVARRRMATR